MINKSRKLCMTVLVLLLLCTMFSFGYAKEKTVIRMVTPFKTGHIIADASEAFKMLVEEETDGQITVELKEGYGSEISCSKECATGVVDMQWAGGQPIQDYAPEYFFFNAPFVIKDYNHFQRVWKSRLGKECRKLIEKKGNMVCLSTLYRGFRQTTANKLLINPNDFVGLHLRLPLVPDWVTVWEALGAAPIQFPLDQLYNVLKEKQAESSEGDLAQIASYNLHEVQTHLIMTNHLVAVGWATANKKFFDSLSNIEREIIIRNLEKAAEWATIKTKLDEGKYLNSLKTAGMIVVTPDVDAIRAKAEPAVNNLFKTKYPVTTWAEILKI